MKVAASMNFSPATVPRFDTEAQDSSRTFGVITLRKVVVTIAFERRVVHPAHALVTLQELGDLHGIFHMTVHAHV